MIIMPANRTILAFIFLSPLFMLYAQDIDKIEQNKRRHISFTTGLNQLKENDLVPLTHTGYLLGLEFGRDKEIGNMRSYNFGFDYSRTKTGYESLPAAVNIRLYYHDAYLFRINDGDDLKWYVGPGAKINYHVSYYPMWDDSHFYWANDLSFGGNTILSYQTKNGNVWTGSAALPVFSILSRQASVRDYKIDDLSFGGIMKSFHNNLTAGSLGTVFYLNMDIEYRYRISGKTEQGIGYKFHSGRYRGKEGKPLGTLNHLITLNLYF